MLACVHDFCSSLLHSSVSALVFRHGSMYRRSVGQKVGSLAKQTLAGMLTLSEILCKLDLTSIGEVEATRDVISNANYEENTTVSG